jgi:beta-lactamase class C
MKIVTIHSGFRLFIIFWVSSFCAVHADQLSTALTKLDQHIQSQVQQKKAIGCAVAVVSEGKIVFMKAYGSRKKGEQAPIDLNTVFQLGSISKPISASLIALLQKQNLLSVETAVEKYYPPVLPTTTIQHLLSHTTGYSRVGWNQKIEAGIPRPSLLTLLAGSPQNTPGQTFDYHNVAYSLIEKVIATTCQQSFKEALTERLLRPLGMNQTSVGYADFIAQSNRAWPHRENEKYRWKPSKNYSHFYHEAVSASGGINANIKDMGTFLQFQMQGYPDMLSTEDLQKFHTPVVTAPDALSWFQGLTTGAMQSSYGQGWRILDYHNGRLVFHGGLLKGFSNFLGFLPERNIGIVILHNAEGRFALKTAMMFFDQYVKEN